MIGKGDTSIDSSIRKGDPRASKVSSKTPNTPGAGRGMGYSKVGKLGKRQSLKSG